MTNGAKIGVALHSLIPVRSESSECAEMVTQMLFMQTCDVLEELPRWVKVCLHDDSQMGFVDKKMLTIFDQVPYNKEQWLPKVAFPMAYALSLGNQQTIPLTAGTCLPNYQNGQFYIENARFQIDPQFVITKPLDLTLENLQQTTRFFLNTPYLWGGKSALGIDCSGFTQIILSLFGIKLPRNASQQVACGKPVDLKNAQAGDLAFFGDSKITHVGILLSSDTIIHASGRVKIEKIDSNGIIALGTNQYTHHLNCVKRLI